MRVLHNHSPCLESGGGNRSYAQDTWPRIPPGPYSPACGAAGNNRSLSSHALQRSEISCRFGLMRTGETCFAPTGGSGRKISAIFSVFTQHTDIKKRLLGRHGRRRGRPDRDYLARRRRGQKGHTGLSRPASPAVCPRRQESDRHCRNSAPLPLLIPACPARRGLLRRTKPIWTGIGARGSGIGELTPDPWRGTTDCAKQSQKAVAGGQWSVVGWKSDSAKRSQF
jgi:hypothetical protein